MRSRVICAVGSGGGFEMDFGCRALLGKVEQLGLSLTGRRSCSSGAWLRFILRRTGSGRRARGGIQVPGSWSDLLRLEAREFVESLASKG